MSHVNTVLSQLLKFVPRHEFETLANRIDGPRKSTAMTRWTQFVSLMTAQLGGQNSLREIELSFVTQPHLQYHLGIGNVTRSSLGRVNQSLDYEFFSSVFAKLYKQCAAKATKKQLGFKGKMFSLDASLIDVSMNVFPQANYNNKKAAYKLHVGLDHDGLIPAFVSLTDSKVSDIQEGRTLSFPKGSVVVFDRGLMARICVL